MPPVYSLSSLCGGNPHSSVCPQIFYGMLLTITRMASYYNSTLLRISSFILTGFPSLIAPPEALSLLNPNVPNHLFKTLQLTHSLLNRSNFSLAKHCWLCISMSAAVYEATPVLPQNFGSHQPHKSLTVQTQEHTLALK